MNREFNKLGESRIEMKSETNKNKWVTVYMNNEYQREVIRSKGNINHYSEFRIEEKNLHNII